MTKDIALMAFLQAGMLPGTTRSQSFVSPESAVYDSLHNRYLVSDQGNGQIMQFPLESADVNAEMTCNIADAVHLINNVFKGGAEPHCQGSEQR